MLSSAGGRRLGNRKIKHRWEAFFILYHIYKDWFGKNRHFHNYIDLLMISFKDDVGLFIYLNQHQSWQTCAPSVECILTIWHLGQFDTIKTKYDKLTPAIQNLIPRRRGGQFDTYRHKPNLISPQLAPKYDKRYIDCH